MLTLVFGGTFDPIHHGHVALADFAAQALRAEVWLLPAADPPHRAPPGASAEDRAAMVALAIAGHSRLRLDRRELERPGPSYMVDTLESIRREIGPAMPLALLLGADAFRGLHTWMLWRELFTLAHLVLLPRAGTSLHSLPAELHGACEGRWLDHADDLHSLPAGGLHVLALPELRTESATELRRRLREGGDWRALVPEPVAEYIAAHGLYREQRYTGGHSPEGR